MNNQDLTHQDSLEVVERDEQLIRGWFVDTAKNIEAHVHPDRRSDMLCVTALAVAGNYNKAIYDLLRKGYHMPSKALLRILCELSAKLAWCLVSPKTKAKRRERVVEKKINQWEKNTLWKNVKILQEFRSIVPKTQLQDIEEAIERKRHKMDKLHCSRMPKTIEIFNKIGKNWRNGIYPRGFLQFNNAVHIDLGSLAERITKNGSEINVDYDSSEDLGQLSGYSLSFMYQIIYLVRLHFGWDTRLMAKQFHESGHNGLVKQQHIDGRQ